MTTYTDLHNALMDRLRLFWKTTDFAQYVPVEYQHATSGYRTGKTDGDIADAIIDTWVEAGMADSTTSKRQLGRRAGVSPNAAMAALGRLDGWFCHVTRTEGDGPQLMRLRLGSVTTALVAEFYEEARRAHIDHQQHPTTALGGQSAHNETVNLYTPRKADDPWLTGTSPTIRKRAQLATQATDDVTPREWMQAHTYKGMGKMALLIVDTLARCGDMTAQELAEETGRKVFSIRRAAHYLETLAILESERETSRAPKVYTLALGWSDRVEELRPDMRTYQITDWREERRLHEALCWQWKKIDVMTEDGAVADEEELKKARRQQATYETQRAAVLQRLYPQFDAATIWRLATDVNVRDWSRSRAERAHRKHEAQLLTAWNGVADLPPAEKERVLTAAGWSANDVAHAYEFPTARHYTGQVEVSTGAVAARGW